MKFLFSHLASSQFSPSYDFLFFSLLFHTYIYRLLDISPLLNIINIISSNNYKCFTNYNFFQCRGRIFIYFIIYFHTYSNDIIIIIKLVYWFLMISIGEL
jgi:hypothetical protein